MSVGSPEPSDKSHKKPVIAVVGAGVVGIATALALSERGFAVKIVDQRDDVAQATSCRNGAQLSYAYADAMAAPGLVAMATRILTGQETGLKFRLKPSLHNYSWLASFVREGSKERFLANTKRSLQIALRSKKQMDSWQNRYGFAFEHQTNGKLQILPNQQAVDDIAELVELKQSMGINQSVLTPQQAIAVEPALARFCGDMAGALYSPDEEVGDPYLFAKAALAQILSADSANEFLSGQRIKKLELSDGELVGLGTDNGVIKADGFVFALGHRAPKFARDLGVAIPVVPVAGYSLTFPLGASAPKHSITDIKAKAVICPLGGKLRIAGFADIGEIAEVPAENRVDQLRSVLTSRFPGAAIVSGDGNPWIGHRPVTPDSQPIVTGTKFENAFVNCGHGTLGWTMAAGTAADIASQISSKFSMNSNDIHRITTETLSAIDTDPSSEEQAISA
ncbi:FAD-dependent oxidoreductase [Maritalea porphyrae]|uniref:D-amino acid dehydrogenase 1 n=1 Tax=Maritalea porphyrae TaxID=880732 RepID=A0ABQ5ULI0_9HYPH|nr:FAD-dependent oxidoreductase [Maritalea porphyrae]GLQ16140.1 D-amino acid dehydrogenase 1 [Maritalea porphyrae]